jgi:hypothetical protein
LQEIVTRREFEREEKRSAGGNITKESLHFHSIRIRTAIHLIYGPLLALSISVLFGNLV